MHRSLKALYVGSNRTTLRFLQIWIMPAQRGVSPQYGSKQVWALSSTPQSRCDLKTCSFPPNSVKTVCFKFWVAHMILRAKMHLQTLPRTWSSSDRLMQFLMAGFILRSPWSSGCKRVRVWTGRGESVVLRPSSRAPSLFHLYRRENTSECCLTHSPRCSKDHYKLCSIRCVAIGKSG